ncbi:hypothetical protein [Paenibacillus humicus]|uniref:hypothetical protein n=1 Tax=Paenibacillus humicus TaxID=412861 RepID=UPI003F14C4F7
MKSPEPYVYSVAVNNNVPINGSFNTYGSGGTQDVERGTLVWNDSTRAYFIQQTKKGDQSTLWVGWNDKYWAQGGISMSLQDDSGWYDKANNEGQPDIDGSWYRSGLLYNEGLNIFLVVSTSECTSSAFRTACKGIESNMVDGIFLDGANAAQMKCSEFHTTHTRPLAAMVEIVNNVSL